MNWIIPTTFPSDVLNRILWWDSKGYDTPYPIRSKRDATTDDSPRHPGSRSRLAAVAQTSSQRSSDPAVLREGDTVGLITPSTYVPIPTARRRRTHRPTIST